MVTSCGGRQSVHLLSLNNKAGVAGSQSAVTNHMLEHKALVKIRHLFYYYYYSHKNTQGPKSDMNYNEHETREDEYSSLSERKSPRVSTPSQRRTMKCDDTLKSDMS